MKIFSSHKKILLTLLLILSPVFFCILLISFKTPQELSPNQVFEEQLMNWFVDDISKNPLNLHYTLAVPENYDIHKIGRAHV